MRNVARETLANLQALFINASIKKGMSPAVVEKDFWVCWILDYLFSRSPWKNHLAFKGGTSLSKAFGLIKRFSEDIDLILDWRLLGYDTHEPWTQRSKTQQELFNVEANARSATFLENTFIPQLKTDLSRELGRSVDIHIDLCDPNTVIFNYPCTLTDDAILREIRIESGSLAAWTPASFKIIRPYVAEDYPHLFKYPETSVYTVDAERTFWEKVTILHREAMRTERQSPLPMRYSRHYYDLWCMCQTEIMTSALQQSALLDAVVEFKKKFYHCAWARYDLATSKTISLMPPTTSLSRLETDYSHMKNMIFGETPSFREILEAIKTLEKTIHES